MLLSVLALELDGPVLRAAAVRRAFRSFVVGEHLEAARPEEGAPLAPEEARMVAAKIPGCPRDVVVVTPEVEMVEVVMDARRVRKMSPEQLREAVRWEAEPYCTLPAAECLVGYELGLETWEGQQAIWVTMFPRADYQALKRALSGAGLRLRRVYPPDVCFGAAAGRWDPAPEKIAVDVGLKAIRLTLVADGESCSYRVLPYGLEALRLHLDGLSDEGLTSALAEVFEAWEGRGLKVVLTGAGAGEAGVADFFRQFCAGAAPLTIPAKSGAASAAFASAAGAALRELYLSGKWKTVGPTDAVSALRLFRERIYLYPLLASAAIIVFFLGHWLWLAHQTRVAEKQAAALKEERETLSKLKNESEELEKKCRLLQTQLDFLSRGGSAELASAADFWAALGAAAPPDLALKEVKPGGGGLWLVAGESGSVKSIRAFVLALQQEVWCNYARIESIGRTEKTEKTSSPETGREEERKEVVFSFSLRVAVKEGA